MRNDLYDIIDECDHFFSLDFLSSLDEFVLQKKIVLPYYDRLSHKSQWGNDADRLACVKEESARHNVIISKVFSEIANGRASHLDGRYELMKALEYARENDCWLIGPSVSRFIRSEEYAQDNQQTHLRKKDLISFMKLIDGVRIATIIPPMTSFSVERGIFSKWGQSGKGNKGGLHSREGETGSKTKRFKGKGKRCVPLFPALREILENYPERDKTDSEFVVDCNRVPKTSFGTQFGRIAKAAGLDKIPRPFDNMRVSRSNEIYAEHGPFYESKWIGHSQRVAFDCYLQIRKEDIQRAIGDQTGIRKPEEKPDTKNQKDDQEAGVSIFPGSGTM